MARRLALLGALLALSHAASAQTGYSLPGLSARELADLCTAGLAAPASAKSASARQACAAYLDAVTATVAHIALAPENTIESDNAILPGPAQKPALFCLPEDEPLPRLAKTLATWLEKNPAFTDRDGASAVIGAFAASYPCQ